MRRAAALGTAAGRATAETAGTRTLADQHTSLRRNSSHPDRSWALESAREISARREKKKEGRSRVARRTRPSERRRELLVSRDAENLTSGEHSGCLCPAGWLLHTRTPTNQRRQPGKKRSDRPIRIAPCSPPISHYMLRSPLTVRGPSCSGSIVVQPRDLQRCASRRELFATLVVRHLATAETRLVSITPARSANTERTEGCE